MYRSFTFATGRHRDEEHKFVLQIESDESLSSWRNSDVLAFCRPADVFVWCKWTGCNAFWLYFTTRDDAERTLQYIKDVKHDWNSSIKLLQANTKNNRKNLHTLSGHSTSACVINLMVFLRIEAANFGDCLRTTERKRRTDQRLELMGQWWCYTGPWGTLSGPAPSRFRGRGPVKLLRSSWNR